MRGKKELEFSKPKTMRLSLTAWHQASPKRLIFTWSRGGCGCQCMPVILGLRTRKHRRCSNLQANPSTLETHSQDYLVRASVFKTQHWGPEKTQC